MSSGRQKRKRNHFKGREESEEVVSTEARVSDWEGKLPEDSVARVTGVWKVSQQTGRGQEAVICRWWAGVSWNCGCWKGSL